MNPFEYASPVELDDVLALLSSRWGETELLAGGTDLVTSLKQGVTSPKRVVSLKAVPGLAEVDVSAGEVRIGAMATLAAVSEHAAIRKNFPSLVHAIESIGSPQIINMATLGGNLCQRPRCWYFRQGLGLFGTQEGTSPIPDRDYRYHAVFRTAGPASFVHPSSLAPALIALGARVTIVGPKGHRELAVGEFFQVPQRADQREHVLKPDEMVTQISVPISGLANATCKVRQRAGLDWPLVTASVAFQSVSAARGARIVLGHVAPVPWPAPKAEAVVEGRPIDESLAARAGEAATDGAAPLSQNAYKVALIRTAVKRAILIAAGLMEA